MTTTKVQQPRKLTENEDNDSFDDFWFQIICYYSRDEAFKPIFDDPTYSWQSSDVENRGLTDPTRAANLNTLLRALATYAAGPYIRNNIIENTTSLQDVRKEFMKYLEIELTDFTALEWFEIKRRPTERPLVFYMRLKYHMTKHMLKAGDMFKGAALTADEQLTPSMQRFIIMEWLHRLDERLVKYVKEKFSTELSSGSTILVNMVETLARNVNHYITMLNNPPSTVGFVSLTSPSLKPRSQLFLNHQWLPISLPEAPTSAVISAVSPPVAEALDHAAMLLVEGIILLVGVVLFQAVEEVHSEDNEIVSIATWSTGVGR